MQQQMNTQKMQQQVNTMQNEYNAYAGTICSECKNKQSIQIQIDMLSLPTIDLIMNK